MAFLALNFTASAHGKEAFSPNVSSRKETIFECCIQFFKKKIPHDEGGYLGSHARSKFADARSK